MRQGDAVILPCAEEAAACLPSVHPTLHRQKPYFRTLSLMSCWGCAGGHESTLILSEQSSLDVERMAAGSGAADLASCDLGVFLFDSSSLQSMTEALQLLLSMTLVANNSLPCVMLAAKDDLGMSQVGSKTLH